MASDTAPIETGRKNWRTVVSRPVDTTFLVLYRLAMGAVLLYQTWYFFRTDTIRTHFIEPHFHLTWLGLDWVRPWPGNGMYIHFYVLAVASLCILLGFYYRLATAVFTIGFAYVFCIDQCWYMNHYYLICLLCLLGIFLPAHVEFSLDASRWPRLRHATVPIWTLWLLRAQVGIPYFFAGIAKINPDWLRGEPLRTWMSEKSDLPVIGVYLTEPWCVMLFSWSGLLLDLLAVPLLVWQRTRVVTLILLLLFHLLNSQLFSIGVFPWLMIAATFLLFSDPRTIALFRFWPRKDPAVPSPETTNPMPRWGMSLLLFYIGVQIMVPLRHHLYPGDVSVSREGHQFSWRMKLNDRVSKIEYLLRKPGEEHLTRVNADAILTLAQVPKVTDPDMIVQICHEIRRRLVKKYDNPQVFARVSVVLNGRPEVTFIGPTTDLGIARRTWGHAPWVRVLYRHWNDLGYEGDLGGTEEPRR